jgi:hypothetical protein
MLAPWIAIAITGCDTGGCEHLTVKMAANADGVSALGALHTPLDDEHSFPLQCFEFVRDMVFNFI